MKPIFILFVCIAIQSTAQQYTANLIPDSLKENANAVVRLEALNVIIKGIDKAIVKHKYVVTILNETGDHYSRYANQYDKLVSLSDINGVLYDANGIKIKSVKRKDIYDVAADDGFSLLTDDRMKIFSFHCKQYPYTVEFEDEQTYNGIYHLPGWNPAEGVKLAVQSSIFSVETPLDYALRYKQLNITNAPAITKDKKVIYEWSLKNYKAIESEAFMPDWSDIAPKVLLAPTKFSIEGYEGDMSTWDGLGKFQLTLNNGRTELPNNIKQKVHELTDAVKSDEEKVKILYNYLQQNTRYISIQLGIGGWQPLPASFVAEKKYGDCKALSNFMICLLKEVGVKALYTIVKAKDYYINNGLYEDFPMSNFNHIITCVPLQKDTMWLECTDQNKSAGYMGTFTGNRKALAITENGGVVVTTPMFKASENKQLRKATATVDDKGDLNIAINALLTGIEQEEVHDVLHELNDEQRNKYLNKIFELPTYTVNKFNYHETKGKIPAIAETIDITAPAYAAISGKRMFVVPNLFEKQFKLENDKPRHFDIVYKKAFTDIDSIEIKIPIGYAVEMMPKNIDINNKFGKYKMTYSFDNNVIKTIRHYEHNTNTFPAKDYEEFVKFYEEMYKADRAKMVLVKM